MMNIEEFYRHKLQKLAKVENKRMRQGMGYNVEIEREFTSPVLKVIEDLGEATVDDIAVKVKLQKREIQSQLKRLQKLQLITSECLDSGRSPRIWSIKL